MTTYVPGNRVRIKPAYFGENCVGLVTETRKGTPLAVQVSVAGLGRWWYRADELEREDDEVDERSPETGTAEAVPGQPADERGGAGTSTEPAIPAGAPAVAPMAVATGEALTETVARLEAAMRLQTGINAGLIRRVEVLEDTVRLLDRARADHEFYNAHRY